MSLVVQSKIACDISMNDPTIYIPWPLTFRYLKKTSKILHSVHTHIQDVYTFNLSLVFIDVWQVYLISVSKRCMFLIQDATHKTFQQLVFNLLVYCPYNQIQNIVALHNLCMLYRICKCHEDSRGTNIVAAIDSGS